MMSIFGNGNGHRDHSSFKAGIDPKNDILTFFPALSSSKKGTGPSEDYMVINQNSIQGTKSKLYFLSDFVQRIGLTNG